MTTQRFLYEFDDFRVDTGQFLLTKGGVSEPITPTVFRILLILLERAGQVVTKDELISYVWPDSFVEEGNLNRNVSTLRKALGEKPSDHKYIETLPKMGYRFIAPVRRIDYQAPTGSRRMPNGPAGSVQHIVGRDEERKELRNAYELAQKGHGGLVCVSGDVGLGKTTLIDVFLNDLINTGQSFHLARARCSESLTDNEPLMPWIEAFSLLAREESVSGLMEQSAPSWYREISHTGSGHSKRMKRELLDFFRAVSPVHPLIVVIDDFQWSDVESVDLLSYLSSRLDNTRVLIVLCYRFVDMKVSKHPFIQVRSDMLSRHACIELPLGLITREQVETHLSLEYRETQFPADYAGYLYSKTEGNPLFIRELVRGSGELTESIRNMIVRKINRVSDIERELLVAASVQGREFDSAVLARSLEMKAEDVEEHLRELDEVHGLIERIRDEELPDGKFTVRYRFQHVFYQEVCHSTLPPSRKASLSASMAEAFLTYYGN